VRKLEIAEAILSLAADRERATAIAGDLLEESRGSARRFCWLVAQTAFLQTGRRFSTAPFETLGIAMLDLFSETFYIVLGTMPNYTIGLIQVLRPTLMFQGTRLMVVLLLGHLAAWITPGREYAIIASWLGLHLILYVGTSLIRGEGLTGLGWFAVFVSISFLQATAAAALTRYLKSLWRTARA
jgi:hypothetical protein